MGWEALRKRSWNRGLKDKSRELEGTLGDENVEQEGEGLLRWKKGRMEQIGLVESDTWDGVLNLHVV